MKVRKIRIIFLLVSLVSTGSLFCQLKSFGSNSKRKLITEYKFTAYAYYDIVREMGLGLHYQVNPSWSVDLSCFYIRPEWNPKNFIKQWDYYYYKGTGISIKPKCHLTPSSDFYIGSTVSLEYIEHEPLPVQYYGGRGTDVYYDQDECKGYVTTVGAVIGHKLILNHLTIEPFFVLGGTVGKVNKTTYSTTKTKQTSNSTVYPYKTTANVVFFNVNMGIKVGFGFKKSKRTQLINEKFDLLYKPRHAKLVNYMDGVDFKRAAEKKTLKKADKKIKIANKKFVKMYKYNYRDTTLIYRLIDNYFSEIDSLIQKAK